MVYKIDDIEEYTIVYSPTIEPIDEDSLGEIHSILEKHEKIVTIEENSSIGSFADKVTDISFSRNIPILNKKIGIPRKFLTNYGKAADHRAFLGLVVEKIREEL